MPSRVSVFIDETPKLRSPWLVCGLPDSGNVAKMVIDQLVKQLGAVKFAELYSNSMPPRVLIREGGMVDPMKHSMFYWINGGAGKDIVLYTGDAQPSSPEAAYALADRALEISQSLGVGTVLTVGAYITGEFVDEPKVFGTGTEKQILTELEELGVTLITEGSITWMNGLLVGLPTLRNLRAAFLSGETSGYIVDAKAARAVLDVLSRKLGVKVNFAELDQMAKESEPLIKSIEQMHGETRPDKSETGYIG